METMIELFKRHCIDFPKEIWDCSKIYCAQFEDEAYISFWIQENKSSPRIWYKFKIDTITRFDEKEQ